MWGSARGRCTVVGVALAALSCRDPALTGVATDLSFHPGTLDFGPTWVGQTRALPLVLTNHSRASIEVSLELQPPFAIDERALRLEGGESRALEVRFGPTQEGEALQTLPLGPSGALELSGEAHAPPPCPSRDCQAAAFDVETGACVEQPLPDGEECGSQTSCVVDGRCRSGACVGAPRSCSDANACTRDRCVVGIGCQNEDVTHECPRLHACEVALCDPLAGCGVTLAEDGAECGSSDCTSSQVCISGQCVSRPTPSGAACGQATPCRSRGRCSGETCVQPAAGSPALAWRHDPAPGWHLRFAGHVSPGGDVYFLEYPSGRSDDAELVALQRSGAPRFRAATGWGHLALDPDRQRVLFAGDGTLEARSDSTGALLWKTNLHVGLSGTTWAAREPVIAEDGTSVVILYEGSAALYAVGVTPQGAVSWRAPLTGSARRPGIGTDGTFWVASVPSPAPFRHVTQLSLTGQLLAMATVSGELIGLAGEEAVYVWRTRAFTSRLPLSDRVTAELVASTAERIYLKEDGDICPDDGDSPCRMGGISAFDTMTGARLWTGKPAGNPHTLSLAVDGGVVSLGNYGLVGLDAAGNTALECTLPAPVSGDPPIVAGRLYAQSADALLVFELPGWDVPARGWAGARGGPSRDGRVRR